MKKLLKLNLKDSDEVMSKEKMGKIIGGGEGEGLWPCPPGYVWSWFHLACIPENQTGPKITACQDKNEGDPCSFVDDSGVTQYGTCIYTLGPLHCSDLH